MNKETPMFWTPLLEMPLDAWISLGVVVMVLLALVLTPIPADMVSISGLGALMLLGVLEPDQALAGFGSQGLVTVGALYVVVAGLQETGGLRWISRKMLGTPSGQRRNLFRLMAPVGAISSVLNNTPVVALFIPVVLEWCRKHDLKPSRFLIPLSYASILGGICTLIGTSTNLVVNSLYIAHSGGAGLGMFDITLLGLPCAVAGMMFMVFFGKNLLPDREEPRQTFRNPREFSLELVVTSDGNLVGKTPAECGLLDVPGAFMVERIRGGEITSPAPVGDALLEGDHLVYAGQLESIQGLVRMNGLRLAADPLFSPANRPEDRRLVEAVVSDTCPLVGKTLREGRFRQLYNAVVIAMSRNGVRLRGSLLDIPLRTGDVLLIESHAGFIPRQHESGDFFLLHALQEDLQPKPGARAPLAFAILTLMVLLAAFNLLSMLKASMLAAGIMLATGCCGAASARRRIEWNVLMVIGAALGMGVALDRSGAAHAVAEVLMGFAGGNPWVALTLVYVCTVMFTEVITNNAAVALVFPIAMDAAQQLGVNPLPFVFIVMIGGSASFATPIGYQTNLMVYGAGGYRFSDYLRVGLPLGAVVGTIAVLLAPLIWPF